MTARGFRLAQVSQSLMVWEGTSAIHPVASEAFRKSPRRPPLAAKA